MLFFSAAKIQLNYLITIQYPDYFSRQVFGSLFHVLFTMYRVNLIWIQQPENLY